MIQTIMDAPPRRPMFEELWKKLDTLPEGVKGEILEPGVITTTPPPHPPHENTAAFCERALDRMNVRFGGKGWRILRDVGVRLPDDRLVIPDLVGWRVERLPEVPFKGPIVVIPDWVCEVLSPSNVRIDRAKKLPLYARSGVPWVWYVDPYEQMLEVYDTSSEKPVLVAVASENDVIAPPPFDLELKLGTWWLPPASE